MREIGRLQTVRVCAANRVAAGAALGEQVATRGNAAVTRGCRRLSLCVALRVAICRTVGDHFENHMRMLCAAELRALPANDARSIGLNPMLVGLAGTVRVLPASCGTQKACTTSALFSAILTGSPTGMWISLAVLKSYAGLGSSA